MIDGRGRAFRTIALLGGILIAAPLARAGGPLIVNGVGQPLTWAVDPVPYNPDRGMLGDLSNAAATAHLAASAAVWTAVPTAHVTLAGAAPLPVDVTVANYPTYLFACDDGLSPIVFDVDGSITDDLLGVGANLHVIGFAAPACGTFVSPVITEGFAVMNGKFLDGVDTAKNPELTPTEFDAVLIHELGHYLGLDHSQVNLPEAPIKQFGSAEATSDGTLASIPGLPRYVPGEEVVLFLRADSARGFTSPVGFEQGVYRVKVGNGRRVARSGAAGTDEDLETLLATVERLVAKPGSR